ncbi:MAG: hypothetical protein NPIRA01_20050 [Nitrospirales bacterium]|nr:MAG: hypothetical protein NPIRA01_20050 [Nitrospirales bacterium]
MHHVAMANIGKTDVFERLYMEKFRALAAEYGEFVFYERDRGARDIGLHITHKRSSGNEQLSSALCWFQLKGIMKNSLPKRKNLKKAQEVKLSLEVKHLRYWFLQPMPTYLVAYIESMDMFLIQDIQAYVAKTWGKSILTLDQKTATVSILMDSVLDKHAFDILLRKSDIKEWSKALETDEKSAGLCRLDCNIIWHFGTATDRKVEHRVRFLDWQSKLRNEFFIEEKPTETDVDWQTLRHHIEFKLRGRDLEEIYPYLEFFGPEEVDNEVLWRDEEGEECPDSTLSNGDVVLGVDFCGEYFEFFLGARLNVLGQQLFESVLTLDKIGLIEITPHVSEIIDVAPWHQRGI